MGSSRILSESPTKLKPIETIYNGYRFRSRLEARWAVFFDALELDYQYEPEGYDLGENLYYLPDFLIRAFLPHIAEYGAWFEVKPDLPTNNEKRKAKLLALQSNSPVLIATGTFDEIPPFILSIFPIRNRETREILSAFAVCIHCQALTVSGIWTGELDLDDLQSDDWRLFTPCGHCGALDWAEHNGYELKRRLLHRDLSEAYITARQARFEYGERGNGSFR